MAATFNGVNPELTQRGQGVIRESNRTIVLSEGFRYRWEQEAFYANYLRGGTLAAKPGTSDHEFGRALDLKILTGTDEAVAERKRLAKRWGLLANVHGEDWHFVLDPKRGPVPTAYPLLKPAEVPLVPKDSVMFLPEDIVAAIPTPSGNGAWGLRRNGGIVTAGDASYFGSIHNTPDKDRPNPMPLFIDIQPWRDGYVCIAENLTQWHYNFEVADDL